MDAPMHWKFLWFFFVSFIRQILSDKSQADSWISAATTGNFFFIFIEFFCFNPNAVCYYSKWLRLRLFIQSGKYIGKTSSAPKETSLLSKRMMLGCLYTKDYLNMRSIRHRPRKNDDPFFFFFFFFLVMSVADLDLLAITRLRKMRIKTRVIYCIIV